MVLHWSHCFPLISYGRPTEREYIFQVKEIFFLFCIYYIFLLKKSAWKCIGMCGLTEKQSSAFVQLNRSDFPNRKSTWECSAVSAELVISNLSTPTAWGRLLQISSPPVLHFHYIVRSSFTLHCDLSAHNSIFRH